MAIAPAVALLLAFVMVPAGASADSCGGEGGSGGDSFTVELTCPEGGSSGKNESSAQETGSEEPIYLEFKWHSPCLAFSPNHTVGDSVDCGIARICASPTERTWQLWGLRADEHYWEYIGSECFGRPPTAADTPQPQVTPVLVLNAIRRIGLPELTAQTQPADKTLVNFATIFYAEPQPFTRSTTLLGQSVDIEATPSQYTWHHGDGTTDSTATPGAPYPSKEITYSYTDAHTTVTPRVDVTYTARFRVNGGAWQDINETVTITGPTSNLRISEATAVLSGEHE